MFSNPWGKWAQAYLVVFGAASVAYGVLFAHRHAPWPLGDWLMNYQGGFVRRGLVGELLLLCSRTLHVPLVAAAAFLQGVCVFCIVASLWPLAAKVFGRRSGLWEKALFFSPASLAFVWLDPSLALRKEIALFALLGVLTRLLLHSPAVPDVWLVALLGSACPALILSHEGLICYFPYLAGVLALGYGSMRRAAKICVIPALLSVAAAVTASLHPGNKAIADKICESVGGAGSGLCNGPIWYLQISRAVYKGEVASLVDDRRMLAAFAITTALALAPVIAGLIELWKRPVSERTRWVPSAAVALAALASVVLFVQAQDWSRWIYIHVMCLLFLLLFAVAQRDRNDQSVFGAESQRPLVRLATLAALVLYATSWHLPEWIIPGIREYRPYGYGRVLSRFDNRFENRQGVSNGAIR